MLHCAAAAGSLVRSPQLRVLRIGSEMLPAICLNQAAWFTGVHTLMPAESILKRSPLSLRARTVLQHLPICWDCPKAMQGTWRFPLNVTVRKGGTSELQLGQLHGVVQ